MTEIPLNPSITSWLRLQPRSRDAEMSKSLQARIYDPLWMLARQWQLGEFKAQDKGSPLIAHWRAEAAALNRYHLGPMPGKPIKDVSKYETIQIPLEALIERERILPTEADPFANSNRIRLAAEAGQHFLRMLNKTRPTRDYRNAFLRQYPFPLLRDDERKRIDKESLQYFDLILGRIPDGRRLYAALRPNDSGVISIDPALGILQPDLDKVRNAAQQWLQWYETLFSEPDTTNESWLPERMEYNFSVATQLSDGEHTLTSEGYSEGSLDWYDFDLAGAPLGEEAEKNIRQIEERVIPSPVSFRGMAAARFWEFEDAQVDFGSVDAGPGDLGRMLLVEFALTYGNDWFLIPLELAVGSIYRTHSLVITDTFGVRTLIRPGSNSAWSMFQHSHLRGSLRDAPQENLFFLTPSVLKSLESQPLEEVLFLRDEMANMAWAVERLVESSTEKALNRFEAYLEQKRLGEEQSQAEPITIGDALQYQLTTEVPDYWIPLLPVKAGNELRLKRGAMLKVDGSLEFLPSLGRVLETSRDLSLFEEEIPREGIRVTRSYQFTRWIDGSSHLWIGRRKRVGRGEGSSGILFDSLNTQK